MAPSADRKGLDKKSGELVHLKPSDSVKQTRLHYEVFLGRGEQNEIYEQSEELVKIVDDFGKGLVRGTIEAAQLAPIIKELLSPDVEKRNAAWLAINQHESNDPQVAEYVPTLAVDIGKRIPKFINKQRQKGNEADRDQFLQAVLELMSRNKTDLVKDPQGVNIESVLISAAMTSLILRNASEDNNSVPQDEVDRALYAAENFYQTLLEIIGYDGLVMLIKQQTDLVHFSMSDGEYDGITAEKLDLADKILDKLPPAKDMPKIIDQVVSKLTSNRDTASSSVLGNTSGHNIQVGSGRVYEEQDLDIDDGTERTFDAVRYVWRVKSRTSLARKTIR